MSRLIMTVCYVIKNQKMLLGEKKLRLGKGLYVGFGGRKKKEDQTLKDTAIRETLEECHVRPINPQKRGMGLVTWENSSTEIELHFFLATNFEGEPLETDEMRPQWFPLNKLPYEKMWPSDRYVLPLLLAGVKIIACFHLKDKKTLLKFRLKEVDSLPEKIDYQEI